MHTFGDARIWLLGCGAPFNLVSPLTGWLLLPMLCSPVRLFRWLSHGELSSAEFLLGTGNHAVRNYEIRNGEAAKISIHFCGVTSTTQYETPSTLEVFRLVGAGMRTRTHKARRRSGLDRLVTHSLHCSTHALHPWLALAMQA